MAAGCPFWVYMADKKEALGMAFPKPTVDLAEIRRKYRAAEREERGGG